MPSFGSLYVSRSGLFAQQRALEVIGQNIANASTTGYTRQEVSFATAEPGNVIHSAGRGIADVKALRYREEFLDRQYRSRNGALGYQDARSAGLLEVEEIIGDLEEGGLRTSLDTFFDSWEKLSLRPADPGLRRLVVSAAEGFLTEANSVFGKLTELRTGLDEKIGLKVSQINQATQELSELNQKILESELNEQQANQLRDRRDLLIDSLSKLAGATSIQQSNGTVTVHLGSLPLVSGQSAYPIDSTVALEADLDSDPTITSTQQFVSTLTWNGTTTPATFLSGEVAALLELRDQELPNYMKYLDNLVRTVAIEVNTQHAAGVVPPVVANDIFDIQGNWMAVQVNATIASDPNEILAGMGSVVAGVFTIAPGDGDRARTIAGLRDSTLLTGGPVGTRQVTPKEYLRTISTVLGLQTQQSQRQGESALLQVEQAEKQRQSVSGVSIDDEMTKMIQFQQAYNASARMINAIDEALDVVVNRLGTFGR